MRVVFSYLVIINVFIVLLCCFGALYTTLSKSVVFKKEMLHK